VQHQVHEWNYVLNESARNFKLNKSSKLGFIIADLLDPFYVLASMGLKKLNYNLILTQSHEDIVRN
jgi:DNA-binding LacI/PurR family transcriptional regulator